MLPLFFSRVVELAKLLLFCYKRAMKILFLLIGVILVLEGLPYAANPEVMQQWLKKLSEVSPQRLRVFGFLAILSGLFLCFLVQKTALFL